MALKPCKECGKDVATSAEKCPNCGAPVKRKGIGCLGAVGLVFAAFVLIGLIGGGGSRNSSTSAPSSNLTIVDGWEWTYTDDWTYVRGSVKNEGATPITYFEVRAEYLNKKGEVVDTDYTNSTERLNPGASKKFEIMHRRSPEFKKVSVSIGKAS